MLLGETEKEKYHVSDEFFEQVFQKLLRREQRGLVQLLLPEVVVVVHWLWRNMTNKININKNQTLISPVDISI